MPFLKAFGLLVVVGFLHVLAGGHLHVLWWPFQLAMTIAVYVGFYLSMIGARFSKSVEPVLLWEVGKASLWPAGVLPVLLSLIHAASYIDERKIFASMIAAALVSPVYSIIIFGAFFRPPSAKLVQEIQSGSMQ